MGKRREPILAMESEVRGIRRMCENLLALHRRIIAKKSRRIKASKQALATHEISTVIAQLRADLREICKEVEKSRWKAAALRDIHSKAEEKIRPRVKKEKKMRPGMLEYFQSIGLIQESDE